MQRTLEVRTPGRGFTGLGPLVAAVVDEAARAGDLGGDGSGLSTLFVQHTSASLLIQENADPGVRRDLQAFFARLAPDGDPLYTHNDEGPDDMPAHVRSSLTATSLSIPIAGRRLALGRWQGVYLWEHRTHPHQRCVVVRVTP